MLNKDVIIIGGGQSGLATAYFLKRAGIDSLILDSNLAPGGAWIHTWNSLRLFSPKEYSSLPGWMMPPTKGMYPTKEEITAYLTEYEKRYGFNVRRPVEVLAVEHTGNRYFVKTDKEILSSTVVVCSTGNWSNPFIPSYKGKEVFSGEQVHSGLYNNPENFKGKRVLIVGGGNSAAQILAEVSLVADTIWVTKEPAEYLPDDVDGRYLFALATKKYQAMLKGVTLSGEYNLARIVMVDSVKDARTRGVLKPRVPFDHLSANSVHWSDGSSEKIDAIIWCTGFRPALNFLRPLNIFNPEGNIETDGPRSLKYPGLFFVGYGDWAGFAAATLIGVQRWAKLASQQISEFLINNNKIHPG